MDFDPAELDTLSREDLILRARARGVERPEQMTRVELRDEIVRRSEPDLERQRRTRGWLGVARDLLASVVESGLNLPDAAAAIRGDGKGEHEFQGPPPVATVTLSEIYATQGHYEQALTMLDEVIAREPEHATARALRDRIAEERDLGPGRRRKVVEAKAETIATPQPPAASVSAPPVAAPAPAAPDPATAAPDPGPAPIPDPVPAAVAPSPLPVPDPVFPSPDAGLPSPDAGLPSPDAGLPSPDADPRSPDLAPAPVSRPVLSPAILVLHTHERAFVYWQLPSLSDSLRLRTITVRPSVQGPAIEEQDHALSLASGGFWFPRLAPGTEVRVALGELSAQGFSPLTVARVLDDDSTAWFEPTGAEADAELEVAARSAAGL